MDWDDRLTDKCGRPPEWAEALPANAESPQRFLPQVHCLLPINGGARENWPRVGLEAMACGVPIVAQREWGWCEMLLRGVTGFLGSNDQELAHYTAALAYDEHLRQGVAKAARKHLIEQLAEPNEIWSRWRGVFAALSR